MDPRLIYILFSKSLSKLTVKFWSEPVLNLNSRFSSASGSVQAGEGRFMFRFRKKCPELN